MVQKLDNESLLMITIFQQVCITDPADLDPTEYLKRHAGDIRRAGELFEYLGLVEYHERAPLGWRPTKCFMEIIAKKAARPSKPTSKSAYSDDTFVLDLLSDAVFGETDPRDMTGCVGFWALEALGLIRTYGDGETGPTPTLLQLFGSGYHRRQVPKLQGTVE
jgi:hypothetical protein